jgi:hypothetical protein
MALHDYQCPACGYLREDVNVPIAIGATNGAPTCPTCIEPGSGGLARRMAWIPQVGRMDAYEPFQEFQVFDGQGRSVTVESMAQMRRIERESEQQARNGEGQQMVWRAYSNDDSNRHDHVFTKDTSRAMDHDLTVEHDAEHGFMGKPVRQTAGEKIPFRTDAKTQRGTPITKDTGAAVTNAHGTVPQKHA